MKDDFLERVSFTQDIIYEWIKTYVSQGIDAVKSLISQNPAYKDSPNEVEEVAQYVETLAQNTNFKDVTPNGSGVRA